MIAAAGFSNPGQEAYGEPAAVQRSRLDKAFKAIRGEKNRELVVQLAEALRNDQI